jgi:hypothetical protein
VLDVNEIQVIRTSATTRAEVQSITILPPSVDRTIDSAAASQAASLYAIKTGGQLQFSGEIGANVV